MDYDVAPMLENGEKSKVISNIPVKRGGGI